MTMKLMYITNNISIANIAEMSGVDWIFVDLEINGKEERQGHLDTVISRHSIEDVKKIKTVLTKSELLVRINPIYNGSREEVDQIIKDGADIIMLPFFKNKDEIETFIGIVNNRVKTCLLVETPEAVENIDEILNVDGIDYLHIGLNDLHLGYKKSFMFELLVDGTVEQLCEKFHSKGIPYGFGGIARIGEGKMPSESIISEHFRLGSSMAILSRSFCNISKMEDMDAIENTFRIGVEDIRRFENQLLNEPDTYFEMNRRFVIEKVNEIAKEIELKR